MLGEFSLTEKLLLHKLKKQAMSIDFRKRCDIICLWQVSSCENLCHYSFVDRIQNQYAPLFCCLSYSASGTISITLEFCHLGNTIGCRKANTKKRLTICKIIKQNAISYHLPSEDLKTFCKHQGINSQHA